MIQGQLHAIFGLLPQNMPFVKSVKSGLDFMPVRLSLGVIFILSNSCQKFKIRIQYLSLICLHHDIPTSTKPN